MPPIGFAPSPLGMPECASFMPDAVGGVIINSKRKAMKETDRFTRSQMLICHQHSVASLFLIHSMTLLIFLMSFPGHKCEP